MNDRVEAGSEQAGIRSRVSSLVRSRTMPLWIGLAAVLANIQVLGSGLFSDDYFHMAAIAFRLMGMPVEGHWWEIFGVPTSRGLSVPTLVQKGMLPWWTSEDYSTSFLRPLAVATHYVDVMYLHARPVLMHAHNLIWYAVLVILVGFAHRRLLTSPNVAALATLMFALDEAHSEGVAWVAGRNTLMSSCAVVGALLAHDHWRRNGRRTGMLLAALLFALGVAAGEGGVGAWAYLFAYALILDQGNRVTRLRSLIPYFAMTAAWLGLYRVGGYGARGGAIYLDPLRTPLEFISALPTRYTLLWLELTTVPNTLYDLLNADFARSIRIASFCVCIVFTGCFVRLARTDGFACFWFASTLLAIVPFCGVASGARLLFVPGIGSTALMALLVDRFFSRYAQRGLSRKFSTQGAGVFVASLCLVLHLVCAASFIPSKIRTVERQNSLLQQLAASLSVRGKEAGQSTVFVLNTATYLFSLLTPFGRAQEDRLQSLYVFGAAQRACTVARRSTRELRLECPSGFLGEPSATFVRKPSEPFQLGEIHQVGPATVRVVALDAHGSATSIDIELENVDDPRWIWTYWDGSSDGYRRLVPPAIGSARPLPIRSWPNRAETHVWL